MPPLASCTATPEPAFPRRVRIRGRFPSAFAVARTIETIAGTTTVIDAVIRIGVVTAITGASYVRPRTTTGVRTYNCPVMSANCAVRNTARVRQGR
ncbi:hypothetical protein PV416_41105 [Streptomyces ipomoeae]|uniref:Uncharacterized protein n=1 Tax=Streptomyces ipomoeae 91-03 TaxID=698759 RepID=L1KST4_9ACTN|nr:hypothetical protein [Streptomyces ipomoeae]EKX63836.1 hypothetical protein STRIP9103_06124 [Streptomyces ipomoeae 91-03]MDX2827287.1 hypothetical protein [Streptomyces ipomoeae]MDX2843789.1 hypothetical protein [Streptomyces ipomoeae]MDX2878099.1 hypothetical protein [Streptomyces ipomoeae]